MENPGRHSLHTWLNTKPDNFFTADHNLQHVLCMYWGAEQFEHHQERLAAFGHTCATTMNDAAHINDRIGNHPRLERYTGIGERTEQIEFHPSYHTAGRAAYESGILSIQSQPGNTLLQSALFYLLAHNGEMGHACPIACTAGLILVLQQKAEPMVRERFLLPLLSQDYDQLQHAAQFLTEVQGGSDVGANICRATPIEGQPGQWQIHGEKWFCSNINADQLLMTARPDGAQEGTCGLGLFLVPRQLDDGSVNHFHIRRLKNKIGTRTMASAEVDFEGALAYQIGPLEEGFKNAVELVLNTSRYLNAMACCGLMARALLEARSYAAHRQAFGHTIDTYTLVQENLAQMATTTYANLASSCYLANLIDRITTDQATERDQAVHRLLVNLNKYATSIAATQVIHRGIEIFGGNGAIEDFSILPRLYRDAIVLESWEGTHNVLCLQMWRDMEKYQLHTPFLVHIEAMVSTIQAPSLSDMCEEIREELGRVRETIGTLLRDKSGQAHARRMADILIVVSQTAYLLHEVDWEIRNGETSPKRDLLTIYMNQHLRHTYDPIKDYDYATRLERIVKGCRTTQN